MFKKWFKKNNYRAYTRKKLNDIIDLSIKCIVLRVLRSTVQRLAVFLCSIDGLEARFLAMVYIQKEAPLLEIDAYSDIISEKR